MHFSGRRKRYDTMPEYVQDETKPTNEDQQQEQHPSQPLEVQPDGTWILGKGADRWIPSENQLGDMRWLVERDLRNELGVPPTWARDAEKIEFHKRQLALLDLAKQAPRCEHVFTDGRCCKAPRVKKGKLCYAHTLMEEKRPVELNLPPLEDANAVMLWLMDVLRGLAEGRTTEKTAGIMLYGLQLAMVNARFTTFQDTDHKEMVRKAPKTRALPQRTQRNTEEKATGTFTAKDAEVAKNEGERESATGMPRSEEKSSTTEDTEEHRGRSKRGFHRKGRRGRKEGRGDGASDSDAEIGKKSATTEEQRYRKSKRGFHRRERRGREQEVRRSQEKIRHCRSRAIWNPRMRGVTPGLNRLSLYFSGLRQGRGWQITAR